MSVDLPPLRYEPDEANERDISVWAAGWAAALDYFWPLLARANADADRYYAAAFAPTDKPKFGPSYVDRRQATTELQEQRAREWQEVNG